MRSSHLQAPRGLVTREAVAKQIALQAERTVFIAPIGEGDSPRIAVSVRAGQELLGSIWAMVRELPALTVILAFVAGSLLWGILGALIAIPRLTSSASS